MSGRVDAQREQDDRFADWARRIRKSDVAAFRALFDAMNVDLLRFAWRYTLDQDSARDVVQDVFTKVWQVRNTLDDSRSLRALLYTMIRNRALNERRSRREIERSVEVSPEWEPEGHTDLEEQTDADLLEARLRSWIDDLPERRREAFILSRYHGMSHEEIASFMGLTPRTVNTHIVLALKDLRSKLESLELQ